MRSLHTLFHRSCTHPLFGPSLCFLLFGLTLGLGLIVWAVHAYLSPAAPLTLPHFREWVGAGLFCIDFSLAVALFGDLAAREAAEP